MPAPSPSSEPCTPSPGLGLRHGQKRWGKTEPWQTSLVSSPVNITPPRMTFNQQEPSGNI